MIPSVFFLVDRSFFFGDSSNNKGGEMLPSFDVMLLIFWYLQMTKNHCQQTFIGRDTFLGVHKLSNTKFSGIMIKDTVVLRLAFQKHNLLSLFTEMNAMSHSFRIWKALSSTNP